MNTTQRLDRAAEVLDGRIAVPAEQRVVAAAQLARSGLELAVAETLTAKGHDLRRAWTASRLTVFTCLLGAERGAAARLAWSALSRACHRHAFDLPPAESEVRALIAIVRGLARGTADG
jgi:hypothetical protein